MIELNLNNVTDKGVRDAITAVKTEVNSHDILSGKFKLITVITSGAVTNLQVAHTLGCVPTDIIETRRSGGTVTWNYDLFTKDTISLTTSAAVSLRFLAGRIV